MSGAKRRESKSASPGGSPPISARRKWTFRLLAVGLPLVPLLVGEVVCRFKGYGGYPPVLRVLGKIGDQTYIGTDQRGLSTFFFQNRTTPGSMDEQDFIVPKPAGTIRIFALGESALRGYPQPPTLAATSFLQAMLSDAWPGRSVEVLNLGTTAIASFPLMYIADEALQYQPDLLIVYAGNNEFYGAHGVASVHAFGQSTTAMRVFRFARRSALVQWLTHVATRRATTTPKPGERLPTLMEQVIADSQIGPEDARRGRAVRNLEHHLTYIVQQCRARGVPVLLCTLPANERDLAPIGDDLPPPLPAETRARFDELVRRGAEQLTTDPAAALVDLTTAAGLCAKQARVQYLIGRCLTELGWPDRALPYYTRARDLDTMPWRSLSTENDVIKRVAAQGAVLCDLEGALRAASPGGAIGWELMDDHVHPALRGQALIAETWLRAMTQLPDAVRVVPDALPALPPWETYAERLGANEFDAYGVAHRLLSLFEAPFYARNNPEAVARFRAICAADEATMTPTELSTVVRWQDPATHQGGLRPITGMVGETLLGEGAYEKANRLLSIARREVPRYSLWNLEFTWNAIVCRRHLHPEPSPEDLALARELIEHGELLSQVTGLNHPLLHRHLGLAYNLLGMHGPAIQHLGEAVRYVQTPEGLVVIEALVDSLVKTGQIDRARRLLDMPVRDPQVRQACEQMRAKLNAPQSSVRKGPES